MPTHGCIKSDPALVANSLQYANKQEVMEMHGGEPGYIHIYTHQQEGPMYTYSHSYPCTIAYSFCFRARLANLVHSSTPIISPSHSHPSSRENTYM